METLDKHFRTLTKTAFEKHGFASADLLSHWPEIVGPAHAAWAKPERIVWSRPIEKGETPTGTLTLRAAPGRALEVQYMAQSLLERINAYLGYGAIAKVKVLPASGSPTLAVEDAPLAAPPTVVNTLDEGPLKDALSRLGAGITTEKSRSPQGQSDHGLKPQLQVGKPT